MVFKFLKELAGAMKEGVAEAKAELAEEQARKAAESAVIDERIQALPKREVFLTSLGAPYRNIFVGHSAFDRSAMEIVAAERANVEKLLLRDFGVADEESLSVATLVMETLLYSNILVERAHMRAKSASTPEESEDVIRQIEALQERIAPTVAAAAAEKVPTGNIRVLTEIRDNLHAQITSATPGRLSDDERAHLAAATARISYLVTATVGIGRADRALADALLSPIARLAVSQYDDWSSYAERYNAGEKIGNLNNFLGRKLLSSATQDLLTEPMSPWRTHPWPTDFATL
jgi:Protein of unknown function (DUF1266)